MRNTDTNAPLYKLFCDDNEMLNFRQTVETYVSLFSWYF